MVIKVRFSVHLPSLLNCAEQLDQVARRQRRAISDLEDTIRLLNRLWGMNRVIGRLNREKQKMEEQLDIILAMAQGLRRSRDIYQRTEQEIMDSLDFNFNLDGVGSGGSSGGGSGGGGGGSVRPVDARPGPGANPHYPPRPPLNPRYPNIPRPEPWRRAYPNRWPWNVVYPLPMPRPGLIVSVIISGVIIRPGYIIIYRIISTIRFGIRLFG